jgi:Flp pilus assembly pilin Flp
MKNMLTKLSKDQRGLSTMEYAVLFVIIVVGAIALWMNLGESLSTQVADGTDTFNGELDTAQGGFE